MVNSDYGMEEIMRDGHQPLDLCMEEESGRLEKKKPISINLIARQLGGEATYTLTLLRCLLIIIPSSLNISITNHR